MTKRFCICVGVAGALLILAAALMVVQYDHQHARTAQHMRLAQAVSDLDGCLTCHVAPAQAKVVPVSDEAHNDLLLATLVQPANETHDATLAAAQDLTSEINTELRTIGHRLLDLPDAQARQATAMIDAYLTVYDTVRADHASYSTDTLLATLTEIEVALRTLEYDAQGGHWNAPDAPESQPDLMLAASLVQGSPPPVAWTTAITLEQNVSTQITVADTATIRITPALAYALLRRGPPAAYAHDFTTTLVAGRRLPVAL
jgi:hypothetical protein